MTDKVSNEEQAEAIVKLRETLTPGDTVRTIARHTSKSGMTHWISAIVTVDGEPHDYSWLVARALGQRANKEHEGIKRGGCGMDMGFDLVYSLSRMLWPEGYGCIGEGCPSNDHSNGDHDYTPHLKLCNTRNRVTGLTYNIVHDTRGMATGMFERDHWHKDGGYALTQRWL